ncbi:PadR family transcriptional regulator [Actinomycetes bacterium KLBMP 9759]
MPTLSASSYVVLGLLDRFGPSTPYKLDGTIRQSIGNFWIFPRSQLYAEAARLVRNGLVVEQREAAGRRRRLLSITTAGRAAFRQWLTSPSSGPTEIRDDGLLRLFFHDDGQADAVRRLATEQLAAHRERLATFEALRATAGLEPGSPPASTLELGLRFERTVVAFWEEVERDGGAAPSAAGGADGAADLPLGD